MGVLRRSGESDRVVAMAGVAVGMLLGLLLGWVLSLGAQSGTYTPYYLGCTPGTMLKVTLPEGQAWGTRESYLVLANPGHQAVTVTVDSPGFAVRSHPVTVAPDERLAIPMRSWLIRGVTEFAVTVTLPLPVSVELLSWDTATWTNPVVSPMTEACW